MVEKRAQPGKDTLEPSPLEPPSKGLLPLEQLTKQGVVKGRETHGYETSQREGFTGKGRCVEWKFLRKRRDETDQIWV